MRRTLFCCSLLLLCNLLIGQVIYEDIGSARLNTHRKLKIKLPKNYDESSKIEYPLIVVFDGDYMFEPVAGHVDLQSYFDDMPESVIVGVVQGEDRYLDAMVSDESGLPMESGLRFFDFVETELIPYMESKYNTGHFRIAIGHDVMGNFINSFLFKENPVFQAYINISPDFQGNLSENLINRLNFFNGDLYYYMATAENDVRYIRTSVNEIHEQLKSIEKDELTYVFDDFEQESHYTMVTSALARGFDKMFDIYKPLTEKELEEKVLPFEGTLDRYLIDRYKHIEHLFGIKKPITEQEIEKVAKVAQEREDLESLSKLGKLSQKLHPDSPQGIYYLALCADANGKTKKAAKLYEEALTKGDSPVITKEFILSQLEEINLAAEDLEEEIDEDEEN